MAVVVPVLLLWVSVLNAAGRGTGRKEERVNDLEVGVCAASPFFQAAVTFPSAPTASTVTEPAAPMFGSELPGG